MKTQTNIRFILLLLLAVSFSFSSSCLGAGNDIKNRMKERLPVLNSLKVGGVIGENNAGFLEFRSSNKKQAALVNDENSDRRQVYEAIAKQQGVDPGLVGSRRALQIAGQAAGGTWLQKPDGSWYQK
ncbi:MAG: YdbL family protein [Pseudomonadota bacterium]